MGILNLSKYESAVEVPDLLEHQIDAYERFLQLGKPYDKRENIGLEAILRETFPITDVNGLYRLDYMGYILSKPKYTPEECLLLDKTYGAPLKLKLRLTYRNTVIEEFVYLCDIPLLANKGEFIINGVSRVLVSQLRRSPGADFTEIKSGSTKLQICNLIAEIGNWLEIGVTKRNTLYIRIDPTNKIPLTQFLRASSQKYSKTEDILRTFYTTNKVRLSATLTPNSLIGKYIVHDIVTEDERNEQTEEKAATPSTEGSYPEVQEENKLVVEKHYIIRAGEMISETTAKAILATGIKEIEVISNPDDLLIINTVAEDPTSSTEEALLKLYLKMRPISPPTLKVAQQVFQQRFFDTNRFRIGKVGRFKMNKKFKTNIPEDEIGLLPEDIVNIAKYILKIRKGEGELDDIDSLSNRRVRMIDELACESLRKGLYRLKSFIQERLNELKSDDLKSLSPRMLINPKYLTSVVDYFFMRGELVQFADQTNPLSLLTHERRLSVLGPGGLDKKHTGFEVRDIHPDFFGRICPIEAPEGANIGLISSRAVYSATDDYGFLLSPFQRVENGKLTGKIDYLRADESRSKFIAPFDTPREGNQIKTVDNKVLVRYQGEILLVPVNEVEYLEVSPMQMLSVSASLIPFLEHDDANRALMGSNMQRQAVPLVNPEKPLVATGMEKYVALNTPLTLKAKKAGTVRKVDSSSIVIDDELYLLKKFIGTNDKTCINQRPMVKVGDKVTKGQIISDGAATSEGELALGRNLLVAFMPWEGYNFEDAIIISQRVVEEGLFKSIHIEELSIEARETKLGREEFTRDIPGVREELLANIGEDGIIRVGAWVKPGDILVGKVTPTKHAEPSPEEKLLAAIFGKEVEDVKNESLYVPGGVEGIVIRTKRLSRRLLLSDSEKKEVKKESQQIVREYNKKIQDIIDSTLLQLEEILPKGVTIPKIIYKTSTTASAVSKKIISAIRADNTDVNDPVLDKARKILDLMVQKAEELENERNFKTDQILRGDELPTGVLEKVKVWIATVRNLQVGDKMSGRHGNKGVVARILPQEDMPYLSDGTPVDIILNPLGVPSRMNIGQILETMLGMAAKKLNVRVITPPFNGATEKEVRELLKKAGFSDDGKFILYDGRTGEPFNERIVTGYIYMMKLHHLVADKIHSRATGPYSLITQQPLGGRARYGGQRFGEMEVWALEAYGASHLLQEMLTIKSDDVDGRTRVYEAIIKGKGGVEPGIPSSLEVLLYELRSLGLDVKLER